ncbi:MAG: hypothetical protein ACRCYE_06680 [Sarcina sp.]
MKIAKKITIGDLKEIFLENREEVFRNLKNSLRITLGKKIKSIDVDEDILYVWMYYYVNLSKEEKGLGDKIILSFVTDFDQMIKKDRNFVYNADTRNLVVNTEFSRVWIKQNLVDMLEYKDGNVDKVKVHLDNVLDKLDGKYTKIFRINI